MTAEEQLQRVWSISEALIRSVRTVQGHAEALRVLRVQRLQDSSLVADIKLSTLERVRGPAAES